MAFITNFNNVAVELPNVQDIVVLNQKLNPIDSWLLDTFFPRRVNFDKDYINLGDIETEEPLAPFVAPCVEGRPISSQGTANVTTIRPAYLKPKESITPCTIYNSSIFNVLKEAGVIASGGGQLSQSDQLVLDSFEKQARLRRSVDNRKRLMASELLTTGKIRIISDDQPLIEVDFGRSATAAFVPATGWHLPASTPVQDINNMLELSYNLTGSPATHVLTTTKVWNALLKNQDFNDTFVKPFAGIAVPYIQTMNPNPTAAQFRGYLPGGNVAIWTYDATYKNGGVLKRFIPDTFFGVISAGGGGTLAHCAIQNLDAFGQPLEYFDSMWKQPDPSAIFMMCESSPMVIPSNKNMMVGGSGFVA
jgi:Phage major capsid protein E